MAHNRLAMFRNNSIYPANYAEKGCILTNRRKRLCMLVNINKFADIKELNGRRGNCLVKYDVKGLRIF